MHAKSHFMVPADLCIFVRYYLAEVREFDCSLPINTLLVLVVPVVNEYKGGRSPVKAVAFD